MNIVKSCGILLFSLVIFSACKKEDVSDKRCVQLKSALKTNNVESIKSIVEQHILAMPSKEYNEANFNKLVLSLSDDCEVSAENICFDCILTLPSASEIKLSFTENGTTFHKIIDISYKTGVNKIIVKNLHD